MLTLLSMLCLVPFQVDWLLCRPNYSHWPNFHNQPWPTTNILACLRTYNSYYHIRFSHCSSNLFRTRPKAEHRIPFPNLHSSPSAEEITTGLLHVVVLPTNTLVVVVVDNQINELFILINNKVFSVPLIDFGVILCNTPGYHILAYIHCPPSPFVGCHAFPLGITHDPTWYFDTGATHHMTNNEVVFQDISPYLGNAYVLVGNEASLPIAHIDSLPFQLGSHQFQINNVLHVPSIRKNLLFVSQFTKDNSWLLLLILLVKLFLTFTLVLRCFRAAIRIIFMPCLCLVRLPSIQSPPPWGTLVLVFHPSKFCLNYL